MARRPRPLAPGLLYHVIARGNQRQNTFLDAADYQAYLERMATYCRKHDLVVYAYCLMPNHVHLLVETGAPPLAKFMQGLQQSYTQYFNRRHRRVGHLFQGRYHAIVCEKDRYLLALVRYIHVNPVRARLVRDPARYAYSGHRAYLAGQETPVLDPGRVLRILGGRGPYRRFVLRGLGEGHQDAYYEVEDQRFLGDEAFLKRVQATISADPRRRPPPRPLAGALKELGQALGVTPTALSGPDRSWAASRRRVLVAYMLVRRLGYRVREVAAALGRESATLSSLLSRVADRIREEPTLRQELAKLERAAKNC
jgi:REP element-mobilizing transposase RayT